MEPCHPEIACSGQEYAWGSPCPVRRSSVGSQPQGPSADGGRLRCLNHKALLCIQWDQHPDSPPNAKTQSIYSIGKPTGPPRKFYLDLIRRRTTTLISHRSTFYNPAESKRKTRNKKRQCHRRRSIPPDSANCTMHETR